ncbi:hypothetical protein B0H63DRAFT_520845 [Podospora didyma]|uniref:Uncharacterized protein n=1 Tax=Podospora didyma TaxID=330526 RepID=A0AAE0U157_9PEZI|nr:hypothetical protein B0H63DRAFT_520845 [Podospora didyma]
MIQDKAELDKADLFVEGRHEELLRHLMPTKSQGHSVMVACLVNILFMTVKYRGHGPEQWTPELIAAKSIGTTGNTPIQFRSTPGASLPLARYQALRHIGFVTNTIMSAFIWIIPMYGMDDF